MMMAVCGPVPRKINEATLELRLLGDGIRLIDHCCCLMLVHAARRLARLRVNHGGALRLLVNLRLVQGQIGHHC